MIDPRIRLIYYMALKDGPGQDPETQVLFISYQIGMLNDESQPIYIGSSQQPRELTLQDVLNDL